MLMLGVVVTTGVALKAGVTLTEGVGAAELTLRDGVILILT